MAPPQGIDDGHVTAGNVSLDDGERVVISGMSGAYAQARNVKDLSEILYKKMNPIGENAHRWNYNHPEVPQHVGLIPDLVNFDAQFFKVHYRLGVTMDPMSRKILENTYQAILDAGINPGQLSGKKVGVYIGSCLSETEKSAFYTVTQSKTGLGIAGCNKSMFANRISYWLNAKGPSLAIDAACCSSVVALEQAYQAMVRGDCEAAIIGGCHLCLHPQTSIHFGRNINLCKDGKTKSYNKEADGCVRSEAVNVLFLQKAKDAKRIYANVVYVKAKYVAIKNTGSFKREPEENTGFLKEFYNDINMSPSDVEYVEGFGSGDFEIDKMELDAFDEVFSPGRKDPLYVGSIISNLGYCESASGIAAITKVLLGYHTGSLASNLHYTHPREDVAAIREGRLRILDNHMPTKHSYIGINGLSITGINSHVLLHGYHKPKDLSKYQCNIPRLVLLSGRTDTAVQFIIDDLKSRPIDAEELALIQNIHATKVNGHLGRGFTILDTDQESKSTSLCEQTEYFDGADRPLWFVYSGMGSQWAEMGAQLLRIPVFAAAIERCRIALEPKGIDIVHIITSPDKTIYNNILHSFVGIAAVQIGLTDILFELGLKPDKIIGHSVGELGCAYADGCLTAEEMILAAYSRGLVSVQTPFILGSMAAVGIGFKEVTKICPPEIEVACHNSSTSSTISGPSEVMKEFVDQLTAKGIFAKEVPCSNIAYHSRYIADAGPELLKYLKDVIKTPKLRSEKWVSTSVPQEKWNEEPAKYSSAEYHTNNLLSPVLFEETSQLIPRDAVLVEVAPHGLLQAILKRSLPACVHVPLTRRGHSDNVRFMLEAIGKLYMQGYYPDITALYPKVEFPVSTGTPHLSHLTQWAHHEKWFLAHHSNPDRCSAATCTFKISIHDSIYAYLRGHQIRGKMVFPYASALVAAWDTLAMTVGEAPAQLSVQFRDVRLFSQPLLHDSRLLRLCVSLHRGNGWFEINDNITKVASGYIIPLKKTEVDENSKSEKSNEAYLLNTEDVYQILNERGYMYRDDFQPIRDIDASFTEGRLSWSGQWAPFLDGLLQINALRQKHDGISETAFIRQMTVKTEIHEAAVKVDNNLKVEVCTVHDYTNCGGITMEGIRHRNIEKPEENSFVLNTSTFGLEYQNGRRNSFSNGLSNGNSNGRSNGLNGKKDDSTTISVLKSASVGDLESLHWVETASPEGAVISVNFAGLNASDVLKANGGITAEQENYISESHYGMDFSGLTKNGDRVMGVADGGAASTAVRAPALLWPVPPHWTLEDAATVPFPYAHAYYALLIRTRFTPRSKVLVSSGAGATGLAIISLALYCQCRVFVVVGDVRKKRFLVKMFPELNAEDIICCRDDTFVYTVLLATKAKGCDYVICGRSHLKEAYISTCAPMGCVVDLHHARRNESPSLGMSALLYEKAYVCVDFSSIFQHRNIEELKLVHRLVSEGVSSGAVRPLPRARFPPREAARALRLLAAGAHRGRVLLRVEPTEPTATHRITCSSERCQLLISDDEGLAIRFANRLIERGAKTLHLQIQKTSARLSLELQSWKKLGVRVKISSEDLKVIECASNLLKESKALGSVEGVFLMLATPLAENTRIIYERLVENLDRETRKKHPTARFFAVVGINNSVGEKICSTRAADHLPATMLSLTLEEVDSDTALLPANYSDIVNVTEQALREMEPVITAKRRSPVPASISQQIAKMAGVTITDTTDDSRTLQDLGMTMDKVQSLCVYLREKHNVSIDEGTAPTLTVEKIREMEDTLHESDYEPLRGLKAFFPFIESDELSASIDTVVMPTLTISSNIREDEFDASEPCLYIIPGMQGLQQRYMTLCERLKLAAIVLQPGTDNPNESIEELTSRYARMFLKKRAGTHKFYILGHEVGVISALEIAATLEDHGLTGTVFCLGGGPEDFFTELDQQLCLEYAENTDGERALQEAVARHMCCLLGVASEQLDAALRDATTWEEKVVASVRALRGNVACSTQYGRLLIELAYARITQGRRVNPKLRALQSRIVLLRSNTSVSPIDSLQRYSKQPIIVHELNTPYSRVTEDLRASEFINQHLDDATLEIFGKKKLCDTYMVGSQSFIGNPDYLQAVKDIKL